MTSLCIRSIEVSEFSLYHSDLCIQERRQVKNTLEVGIFDQINILLVKKSRIKVNRSYDYFRFFG